jgi:glycosyltransferase involved in cell wall biosynthesis
LRGILTISLLFSDDSRENFNYIKKHLLILGLGIFEDSVGGITAYQSNLVRQLVGRPYQVSVMIPRTRPDQPSHTITPEGVTIYRYGSARGMVFRLIEQLTEARPLIGKIHKACPIDLINVHFALTAWGLMELPHLRTIPKLMHYHGPWPLEWMEEKRSHKGNPGPIAHLINFIQVQIEKRVVHQMDDLVFMSRAFVPYVKDIYKVEEDKLHVMPICWDTQAIRPLAQSREECRQALSIPPQQKVLLSVRRLVKRTGVDMLLEAVAPLTQEFPELAVYIAGRGPEAENLRELARQLNIDSRVHFLGFVPDEQLPMYYRAADLSCVPTRSLEGFGTIVIESLVQGTPVIATPVGGLLEIIPGLSRDLLTADISTDSLRQKIRAWLTGDLILPDDPKCRNYVTQSFHWDKLFPRLEAIFRKYGL